MLTIHINYLAILLCGVVAMVLGTLWYGPLFGKYWMKWSGITKPATIDAKTKKRMIISYIVNFISSLVVAFALSFLLRNSPVVILSLLVTTFLWLGFVVPFSLGSVLWEGKSWKVWILNNTYNLILMLLMAAIVTKWH